MMKRHRWKLCVLLLISLVLLLINSRYDLIALHPLRTYADGDIKVLCMNVHSTGDGFEERSLRIDSLIKQEDPDFVFLTEYHDSCSMTLDSLLRQRYAYCQRGIRGDSELTECVYSRWQIDSIIDIHIDSFSEKAQTYSSESESMADHIYHSAILKCELIDGDEKIVIYTCHLTSNNYLQEIDSIQYHWHPSLRNKEQRLRAYQYGGKVRELEIDAICKDIEREDGAVIVMGDMNDFSASAQLQQFEDMELRNAWSEGGFGYGSTFNEGWFALRIDHMYYNNKLRMRIVKRGPQGMSDHRALIGSYDFVR